MGVFPHPHPHVMPPQGTWGLWWGDTGEGTKRLKALGGTTETTRVRVPSRSTQGTVGSVGWWVLGVGAVGVLGCCRVVGGACQH